MVADSSSVAFLDTGYTYALVNTRDQWHDAAVRWQGHLAAEQRRLLTTDFVLVEVADGLAAVRFRGHAVEIISALRQSPLIEVVSASTDLFEAGLETYCSRPDKDWGLTDCISFVAMRQRGLTDALAVDEHFRQAGFRSLLLDEELPGGGI